MTTINDEKDDLEFQKVLDSGLSETQSIPLESNYIKSPIPNPLLENTQFSPQIVNASIFSLDYYKHFFNVNTEDVGKRILMTINPLEKQFFTVANPPDLYGPIWISFTSIFLMLIFGNLTCLFDQGRQWTFNFYPFVVAGILTSLYVFGCPFLYRYFARLLESPTIIQLICLFGYSTVFMIPTGLFCLIVGLKASFFIGLIGSFIMGWSIFTKLNHFYESSPRALIPNLVASGISSVVCFLVAFLLFR